ncbi:hypothetical protein Tco_1075430 [Tanacetum coccineum]
MEILPQSISNSSAILRFELETLSRRFFESTCDLITDPSSEIKLRGRLLESFQKDAKYEHVGQDTKSQNGKDNKDKQEKDLKISELKIKSKDNDKSSRSKIRHHEGTSLQQDKDQDKDSRTQRQSNLNKVQGSKIQDLTLENLKTMH